MIDEIMTERLKHPGCMIDAEALASQDSQKAFEQMQQQQKMMSSAMGRSDGGSQRSGKGSSKHKGSQSKATESVSKS